MLRLLLFLFPASEYVIAVFSRPIGAAVPGFETGNSKVDIRHWSARKSSKGIVITPHPPPYLLSPVIGQVTFQQGKKLYNYPSCTRILVTCEES